MTPAAKSTPGMTDLWSLRSKLRHSSGRFSVAAFASWRLGENRRLNKEAKFAQGREGAKAPPFISQRPLVRPPTIHPTDSLKSVPLSMQPVCVKREARG